MQTLIQAIIIVGLDIVDYSLEVDKKRVGKRIKNDMKSSAVKLNKSEKQTMVRLFICKFTTYSVVTYRYSVGELRQGGIDWRCNVNYVCSAQWPPKQEKAHCWLSQ